VDVAEDVAVGSAVYVALARDRDAGPDGEVEYRLEGVPSGAAFPFAISRRGGAIVTNAPLDRERQSQYRLRVVARDDGLAAREAEQLLTVTVTDVNDNAPVFGAGSYRFAVNEGLDIGTLVGVVSASDLDAGANGERVFALTAPPDAVITDTFVVDPASGVISTKTILDRESVATYLFSVTVQDRGNPLSLSTAVEVVVTVSDENDNAPVFHPAVVHVNVSESISVPAVIGQMYATDADSPENNNGQLRYTITNPAAIQGRVTIDGISGEVTLLVPLDYEAAQTLRIEVRQYGLTGAEYPLPPLSC